MHGRLIRKEKVPFSNENGYVCTRPKSVVPVGATACCTALVTSSFSDGGPASPCGRHNDNN